MSRFRLGNPPPEVLDRTFRLVGDRTVARVSFLRIDRLHYASVDGAHIERVAVRHPGAVVVVPLDGNDVVLIEQFRAPIGRRLLELPAGKLDKAGEEAAATANRELEEEVGLTAETLDYLGEILTTPGFSDELITMFVASGLTPTARRPSGAEEIEATIVRMSLDEAVAAIERGEISDAKTVAALLMVARRA